MGSLCVLLFISIWWDGRVLCCGSEPEWASSQTDRQCMIIIIVMYNLWRWWVGACLSSSSYCLSLRITLVFAYYHLNKLITDCLQIICNWLWVLEECTLLEPVASLLLPTPSQPSDINWTLWWAGEGGIKLIYLPRSRRRRRSQCKDKAQTTHMARIKSVIQSTHCRLETLAFSIPNLYLLSLTLSVRL